MKPLQSNQLVLERWLGYAPTSQESVTQHLATAHLGLLIISLSWQIHVQEKTALIGWRECSKKSAQQGRSHFDARSIHGVREHRKMARTPLATFFNIPHLEETPA